MTRVKSCCHVLLPTSLVCSPQNRLVRGDLAAVECPCRKSEGIQPPTPIGSTSGNTCGSQAVASCCLVAHCWPAELPAVARCEGNSKIGAAPQAKTQLRSTCRD